MRGVTAYIRYHVDGEVFQLTRLMRGVTAGESGAATAGEFQLTRLMRGVTHEVEINELHDKNFNSHASCEA